ncbi:hypothetical protein FGO68_gene6644 [Halteria grandinella]|uniref:Uncharacterized protein n=1 Tax=Halteria grandinella TaxID=5974 RepID=A0A8J8SZS1_HALGN|nr:hypothetical protein FGO68_gene6644 [Halteria grandinella]
MIHLEYTEYLGQKNRDSSKFQPEVLIFDDSILNQIILAQNKGFVEAFISRGGWLHSSNPIPCADGTTVEIRRDELVYMDYYDQRLTYYGEVYEGKKHGRGIIVKNYGSVQIDVFEVLHEFDVPTNGRRSLCLKENWIVFVGHFDYTYNTVEGFMFSCKGLSTKLPLINEKYKGYSKKADLFWNKYEGAFVDDVLIGTCHYSNGDFYEGQLVSKADQMYKREGHGYIIYKGGTKWKGQWKNDEKHGMGIETQADGTQKIGEWEYDEPVGEHRYIDVKGKRIKLSQLL